MRSVQVNGCRYVHFGYVVKTVFPLWPWTCVARCELQRREVAGCDTAAHDRAAVSVSGLEAGPSWAGVNHAAFHPAALCRCAQMIA
jgi:hypothetical protein